MDYPYEQLDPERFQHLCQALLVREYPALQCLPVAQRDGGRDALQPVIIEGKKGAAIFQVKFVRNTSNVRDARKWLINIAKAESPKIVQLLPEGAEQYVLITNVAGTAHPKTGSIDALQAVLDDAFPIPAQAWWRDDLNRRLDGAYDVRWAYWELLQAPDLLRALLESGLGEARERRLNAIQAFVAKQHELDEQVRFKQIELENDLMGLFIDVPAGLRRGPGERRSRHIDRAVMWAAARASSVNESPETVDDDDDDDDTEIIYAGEPAVGAGALFLSEGGQRRYQRVILDGAPGQGKSTLAQYICQVHRLLLLRKSQDLDAIPKYHRPAAARLPIKVDLREYAAWVGGANPFSDESDQKRPTGTTKSLESFLSALITFQSGGSLFEVSDLQAVVGTSAVLLVLDGLDEVAEIGRREEVAREINSSIKRLAQTAASLQIIVTTRPSALAEITGFSSRAYYHFTLQPLTRHLIDDYARRWTQAKRLDPRQASRLKRIFKQRLNQPHLGDLARNPMQLAILLSVINAREDSFPDKRTALYDMYVEIFLARESAKSEVVRTHRELLVDVHMYLAWVLHAGAETGQELGRIDQESLQKELSSYLTREGRDPSLANELFGGVTQRVVFLVQRVEGTYEFEVQPLREYFAGRYLYETAPYSPPGRERKGTKPDRFDGLAKSPYWLNVTRFFAGCFSKGEQPALAERLQSLAEDPEYKLTGYPRVLAAILVGDWAFAQSQRSLRAVVNLMTSGAAFRQLLYGGSRRRGYGISLTLPSGSGREELVERCFQVFASASDGDITMHTCQLVRENAPRIELLERWMRQYSQVDAVPDRIRLLYVAHWLGVLSRLTERQFEEYIGGDEALIAALLDVLLSVRSATHYLESNGKAASHAADLLLDGSFSFFGLDGTGLRGLASTLSVVNYYPIFVGLNERMTLNDARAQMFPQYRRAPTAEARIKEVTTLDAVSTLSDTTNEPLSVWRTSLRPWNAVIELIRSVYGERWALQKLGALASTVSQRPDSPNEEVSLFEEGLELCVRTRLARLRAGYAGWWKSQFSRIETTSQQALWVLMALVGAGPTILTAMSNEIDEIVDDWSDDQYQRVLRGVQEISDLANWGGSRRRFPLHVHELPKSLSARGVALFGGRASSVAKGDLFERYLSDYTGDDQFVQEFRQEVLLEGARRDPSLWYRLLDVVKSTYARREFAGSSRGVFAGLEERLSASIPLDAARTIAGDYNAYPVDLVVLAERKCHQTLSEQVEPLAVVAGREGWFEEELDGV